MENELFYRQIALFFKSMADENRLKIIMNLSEGKKSVSRIVEETGLSQPLISHHLKELKGNHIVQTERQGSFIFYQLAEPEMPMLIKLTNQLVVELNEKGNAFTSTRSKPEFPFQFMMQKMFEFMNQ